MFCKKNKHITAEELISIPCEQSGISLCLFTCSQSRGSQEPPITGQHVSHRGCRAIVTGRGRGQASALPRRPIQTGDQQRRRQEEEQQRKEAIRGGHVGRGGKLKDITRPEERARGPSCVFVHVTRVSSRSSGGGCGRGSGWRKRTPRPEEEKRCAGAEAGRVAEDRL